MNQEPLHKKGNNYPPN